MKLALTFCLFLLGQVALAQNDCTFEGVRSVESAIYSNRQDSPSFKFKYQVVGNLAPEEMVVVFLPGGPGSGSIDDYTNPKIKKLLVMNGLPEDLPWVMIDPRTVGCNEGDEIIFPDDSLTSENMAYDVLSVIKTLGLRKYILYGHSYGSQSATFVAGLAQQRNVPAPHALFLSGVLGRGEEDGSFSIPFNIIFEWELIKKNLSPKALRILQNDSPLEIENPKWNRFIFKGLYQGFKLIEDNFKNTFIENIKLLESDDEKDREKLKLLLNPPPREIIGANSHSDRLFREVDCHEFSPDDGWTYFSRGSLIFAAEENPCKGEAFDRRYDSSIFEITSPIYYLAGSNDPAAPYLGARYHYENQNHARRNFITIPGGGHATLGDIFPDCRDQIWNAIYDLKDLDEVLQTCKAPVKLEVR